MYILGIKGDLGRPEHDADAVLIHDTVWWLTNRKDMNQTKISDQKDVLEFNQTFLANINNQ